MQLVETILSLLILFAFIAAIVGLFRPKTVIPWFKKPTRLKALGTYFAIFFVTSAIVGATTDPKQLASYDKIQNNLSDESKTTLTNSQLLSLFCKFEQETNKITSKANKKFGLNPRNTLKTGDTITAGKETIMQITNIKGINDNRKMLDNTKAIIRIPKGGNVTITRVIDEPNGAYWYEAKIPGTSHYGYIQDESLLWFDTLDKNTKHLQQREEWTAPRYKELEKTIYTDNGVDRWEIEERANKYGWRFKCQQKTSEHTVSVNLN